MARIDDRIAELTGVLNDIQRQLDVLTSKEFGDVEGFLRQAEAASSIPSSVTATDAALLINLWEKYKAGPTRSTSG